MQHRLQPFYCQRRAWPGSRVAATAVSLVIWYSWVCLPCNYPDTPGSPPRRITGCWCFESSHPPRHVACITVQLITVSKCPVGPSLYNRWLRPEPSQPSDRDQARTWSHVIAAYSRRSDRDQMLIEASPRLFPVWEVILELKVSAHRRLKKTTTTTDRSGYMQLCSMLMCMCNMWWKCTAWRFKH